MKKEERDAVSMYVSEQETQETAQEVQPKSTAAAAREQRLHGRDDLPKEEETGLRYKDNLGYLKIDVASLPTQGMFYPEGTEILIRAARGEEIKHWSTMNDQDVSQLSQVDDILNYIIERCVSVKLPGIVVSNSLTCTTKFANKSPTSPAFFVFTLSNTLSENVKFLRLLQPLKAPFSIFITPLGIITLLRPVQPLKAL